MKVHTIGGYSEVGKNMTVVEMKDDAIAFDCGLYLPAVIDLQEKSVNPTTKILRECKALPDDLVLNGVKSKVRAFLLGHAHLDHLGAIPYISNEYRADIVGTPFTIEVLRALLEDKIHLKNQIKPVHPNSSFTINGKNKKYVADFLNITHSTIQTSLIALHTDEGAILYANDFKLDNNPIVGKKPNYEIIKKISKEGVKLLIVDSLYSGEERKTPSEKIARALLEEVLLTVAHENRGIVITTFSSHIARLKSIVDFSKQLGRKIVFVGRSLNKYVSAAKKVKMCPFEKDIQLFSYKNQLKSALKKVNNNRKEYVIVCTGHQGEPDSILDRMSKDDLPFKFNPQDSVIFASRVIPTTVNIANRQIVEKRLKHKDVRIFDNIHVSGHAGREDLRDFINMINPENIIPAHGSLEQLTPMVELAKELGYKFGKTVHLMQNSQTLNL